MKTPFFALCSFAVAAAAGNASGAAVVSNVSFTQNGAQDVVITYDLDNGGNPAFVAFDVLTNGVPLPVAAVVSVSGDFSATLADAVDDGPGKTIVWKARDDWKGNISSNATVVVAARDPGNPVGIHLRVDVTGGTAAKSWPWRFSPADPVVSEKTFLWDEIWLKCVPAGTFVMGSPEDENGREYYGLDETRHKVTLTKPFFIGVAPVTRKQWTNMGGSLAALPLEGLEGVPAGKVNYYYPTGNTGCNTLLARINAKTGLTGFALPTEAQWEYACRADTQGVWGDGSSYDPGTTGANPSTSANLGRIAWYQGNSAVDGTRGVHQVATKEPNAWGLYDFHGNVWEWCRDWAADYPHESVADPTGPDTAPETNPRRIRRGGSYNTAAFACRAAIRNAQGESDTGNQIEGNGVRFVFEF